MAAMLGYGLSNSGLSQSHQAHVSVSCSHFPFDFRGVVYFTPHSRRGFNPVSILHNSAVLESNFVCLCFSSSHLRPSWISISPIQFKTSYILQPLIRPKASDFTLRSSNVDNPDIGVSIKPKQSDYMDPSTSESALAQFETISPEDVKVCLRRKGMLKYYTLLAGQLASEGYMTQFTELLQMLADAGIDKELFTYKLDTAQLNIGFRLLLSRQQLDLFVSILRNLTKAGYTAPNFVQKSTLDLLADELLSLVKAGRTEFCVELVEYLTESGFFVRNLIDPVSVVSSCAKLRNIDLARRFVELLSRNPWHYNLIIREFSRHGNLRSCFKVLDFMKELGVMPDVFTYRVLIDSCGRHKEPSKATIVFEKMLNDGFEPNRFVYNSIMNVNVGNLSEVRRYFQHMQGAGIAADVTSYNILLKAYAASGRADLAGDLYAQIKKAGKVTLDVVFYSTLINVFGKAKMWEEALRVKADMLEAGVTPNVVTWTSIIGACATAGLVDQSFREFDEMLNAGCRPNVNCYNMLLQACIMASQFDRAFLLFEEWKTTGRMRSYSEIFNYSAPLAKTHELITVIPGSLLQSNLGEKIDEDVRLACCRPNIITYNCMMKACGSASEKVRSLMREMRALGLVPDVKSWSILLDSYGSKGDVEGASEALEEMKAAGFKPDVVAYTSLIQACVQAGHLEKAFDYFSKMKAAGVRPNAVTYNSLLRRHRNYGTLPEVQRALALYEEMREAGHVPNDFILQELIKEWVEGLSNPSSFVASGDAGLMKFSEAVLQKVAVDARREAEDNRHMTIDLHGLTKGEARAAVLVVLRAIKERYLHGIPVEDDLIIITGIGNHSETKGKSVLRDVVLGILQKELGLTVVSVLSDAPDRQVSGLQVARSSGDTSSAEDEELRKPLSGTLEPRKPSRIINSGRLKVTKESLNTWLEKKSRKSIN
ncbi:pentatricopeptide repeat-containing protein At5g02830, chloroplastic [Physcomitrium patens]|uniref:Smr domain-containing protein n=1 Tax=Physcomitrium patens TaxID=3218 RepID=A0A2K1IM22_PHYPA|nr:pentatricopeptide repeat-containing protein At5g02830, chloroplastic-like [Physcomitrium patens]PNR30327.1 hypothetical protein PHYPA_026643 [Physcomitrium patens]|eukprot:XP_024360773.1 pentatricopeptide repeat-containing protein At5g02830, chloroplastic-like [Physcomitrella patens]